ncbi:MAG: sigma-E processing peptidase SpoIIGA [Corallococcus sp.]|nr:sigma-E processing peptidase SpoIIGA [Corallococcus sp.]
MNVYVEYVILDNLTLDCLILWLVSVTLKLRVSKLRIFFGGLCGAACAIASVFTGGVWLYVVKAASLIAMCLITVGFGKKLFWYILLTVAYTFMLGGAIIGVFGLLNVDYVSADGTFYNLNVPLFAYVLAIILLIALTYSIAFYVKQVKKIAPFLVDATVILDKEYRVTAFCDSGNSLTFESFPVCFVTKNFGGFASYYAEQLVRGNARQVEVMTVAGKTLVGAVKATVRVRGQEREAYLALPASKCRAAYNLLLSNEFCAVTD